MTKEGLVNVITNVVLSFCAVALTAFVLFRPTRTSSTTALPVPFPSWEAVRAVGHKSSSTSARIEIVEFADFECPVCRYFALKSMRGILSHFPSQVLVTFRHWPLGYHRFAYPAARAAECASTQGRFWEFHDTVYLLQDSLGLRSFDDMAKLSGVPDLQRFHACNLEGGPVPAIETDKKVAEASGFTGTPTIIIDGLLYLSPPDSARLDQIIGEKVKVLGRAK